MSEPQIVERIAVRPEALSFQEHMARYEFARAHLRAGPVLDVAAGSGYGTELLLERCGSFVVGMDVDLATLGAARRAYPNGRITFMAADGTAMPFADGSFATITSMETVEHIADDVAFVGELHRVLRTGGVAIISTPNRLHSERHNMVNPYHVREYTEQEFAALLLPVFASVQVFRQAFSETYHGSVRRYAGAIQDRKSHLAYPTRWLIDHVYRPLRHWVPSRLVNVSINRSLGLSYPQPSSVDITITDMPVDDCRNLVAVCVKA